MMKDVENQAQKFGIHEDGLCCIFARYSETINIMLTVAKSPPNIYHEQKS